MEVNAQHFKQKILNAIKTIETINPDLPDFSGKNRAETLEMRDDKVKGRQRSFSQQAYADNEDSMMGDNMSHEAFSQHQPHQGKLDETDSEHSQEEESLQTNLV